MATDRFPHITANENGKKTLYVDGKPYFARAGELHNSSASSGDYMEREVWPYLRSMHMNTVLLTVAWEDIEPTEGVFDFSIVQTLLEQARREGQHLVILWFGLWKNGESFYVPRWVKEDTQTYFRVVHQSGVPSETISPFCQAAVEKDKLAFTRLMGYLAENDQQNTVIMIQVENEIGVLGSERDFGPWAEEAYLQQIPEPVAKLYDASGDWATAFGELAPARFMAWHYGLAVEQIASAGKAVWPLPYYINAWQDQHPARPGSYPSGGPIAPLITLWQTAAPSIDLSAPDIYVPDFVGTCKRYMISGNPLFVPETYRTPLSASNALWVAALDEALGFAPFGIEDMPKNDSGKYVAESYRLLEGMGDALNAYKADGKVVPFVRRFAGEWGTVLSLPKYDLQLDFLEGEAGVGVGGFVILQDSGFYILGTNVKFKVLPKVGSRDIIGLARLEEGEFADGCWVRGRVLNGDELRRTALNDMPEWRFVGVNMHR